MILVTASCARGGSDELIDAGALVDATAVTDAGIDARLDSSSDASIELDASDSATPADSATPLDAGTPLDSSTPVDMGTSCAAGTQDNDGNGSCLPSCEGSGVCSGMLGCDDTSGTAVCSECPITEGAALAWQINIPVRADWDEQSEVVYTTDNRASLSSFAWTRVAYCMVFNTSIAYAEMDDYMSNDLARVAIPVDFVYDQPVANLTVRSNVRDLSGATRVATGTIEMWSNCYQEGANLVYDYDDDVVETDCYGSFQVHNGTQTILAWNGWSYGLLDGDIGIGNNPEGGVEVGVDWTHARNIAHTTRRLMAYLVP